MTAHTIDGDISIKTRPSEPVQCSVAGDVGITYMRNWVATPIFRQRARGGAIRGSQSCLAAGAKFHAAASICGDSCRCNRCLQLFWDQSKLLCPGLPHFLYDMLNCAASDALFFGDWCSHTVSASSSSPRTIILIQSIKDLGPY
jgi:hypothetical protein